MSSIVVHPRINERHPEVKNEDVAHAVRSILSYRLRPNGRYIAVGLDSNGRLIELVYIYDEEKDVFFVFHGMTPPSRKTLQELGMER